METKEGGKGEIKKRGIGINGDKQRGKRGDKEKRNPSIYSEYIEAT